MSIASFVLSLLGGLLAIFQGGCVCAGGGAFAQYDREMARLGAGGFLIVIAAVTGFVGGAMAFTKKPRAKIILGTSAGLCLFAMLAGFSDGIFYCLIYSAAAVLAHLDTAQKSVSHEAVSRPLKININIDFRSIFQRLRDAFTSSKHIHMNPLDKYLGKYVTAGRTKLALIACIGLPFHMYNPVFWLGCFLKYKKHEHADKILFEGILSTLVIAKIIDVNYLFFRDYLPYLVMYLASETNKSILMCLFLFGLQAFAIYSAEKILDRDKLFEWLYNHLKPLKTRQWAFFVDMIAMSVFLLTVFPSMYLYLEKNNYPFIFIFISYVLSLFTAYSLGYFFRSVLYYAGQPVSEKPVAPENTVSAPAKTDSAESIQDMSKKGFELLKASDFKQAKQIFDQILAKNPRAASAYIGKLMSLLRAKNGNELVALPIRLEEEELFQKAMTYANPKMKEILGKYIQANNAKNSQAQ